MKVLVIDDEPLVRLSLQRLFSKEGYQVHLAENGKQGLELWLKEKPEFIFLDVIMPHLTGPEVLAELGSKKTGKVFLMSAFSGEQNVETAKQFGADDFIEKPFANIFDLLQKVKGH